MSYLAVCILELVSLNHLLYSQTLACGIGWIWFFETQEHPMTIKGRFFYYQYCAFCSDQWAYCLPLNLCGTRESWTFLRLIYVAINNQYCPWLIPSASSLLIQSSRHSSPIKLRDPPAWNELPRSRLPCCSAVYPYWKDWQNSSSWSPSDLTIVISYLYSTSLVC